MQTKRHLDTQNILFVRLFLNSIIDGTVEGTDIHTGKSMPDWGNDGTYYGNGCPNSWNNDIPTTYGGSDVSCSSRLIEANDGETQSIGTYYNYSAAVAGLSIQETVADTSAPNSFCPFGWQLPYRGTGGDYYEQSKYWDYLLSTYHLILYDVADGIKFGLYPLSFVRSGFYRFNIAYLFDQGILGRYWSPFTATQTFQGRRVDYGGTIGFVSDNKIDGDSIRCVYSFIDGTVEGTNINKGTNWNNVYYGLGCTNGWDTNIGAPSYGGSATSCSIRNVNTVDNETQSIGTYYTYHTSTLGSIGSSTEDNANAPDTFCPLGWQMPYGGTGGNYYDKSKSWKYLVETIYQLSRTSGNVLQRYPFSIIRSGGYVNGYLHFTNGLGRLNTSTISSSAGYYLAMISGEYQISPVSRGEAYPLRCVSEFTKDASEKIIEPPQTLPAKSQA